MGLTISAKGLPYDKTYDCGYITFLVFRKELAKAFNAEFGSLYERWCSLTDTVSKEEIARIEELGTLGIKEFLFHSDCDGKLTPDECRRIYKEIKDIKLDMVGHNYGTMKQYNMLDQWKGIVKHCADRRVTCWFT